MAEPGVKYSITQPFHLKAHFPSDFSYVKRCKYSPSLLWNLEIEYLKIPSDMMIPGGLGSEVLVLLASSKHGFL